MEHYKNDNLWCVYYHKCRTNGKYYVGITKNTTDRWRLEGVAYKGSRRFWNALQKYGWNDFDHIILFTDLVEDQAKLIEIQLIAKFDLRNPQKGYNISKGGDTGAGLYGSDHPMSRPVYQYSWNGEFIKEWETIRAADNSLSVGKGKVWQAANGSRKQAGGYQWSFEKVDRMPPYIGFPGNTIRHYPKVYRINYDGKLEKIYDDLHKIEDFSPAEYDRVRECCLGRQLSTNGSFWLFEPDYTEEKVRQLVKNKHRSHIGIGAKEVCVYDESGKFINTFPDCFAASEFTGVIPNTVRHACNSKNGYHHYGGYLFYYFEETLERPVEPWKNGRLRPVLHFHDGEFVEKLSTLREGINKYGGGVQYAVGSKKHCAYGDIWIYEKDYSTLKDQLNLGDIPRP